MEIVIVFGILWFGTKLVRLRLDHKKQNEILQHQEKLAMINRGMDPIANGQNQLQEIRNITSQLQNRVETIEAIVTSTDYELNKRFQALLEKEKNESYLQLEQISQALTSEYATNSTLSNRYRILEEIGRGGMGIVLKAEDTELNEIVALKLITPQISTDENVMKRFKQEAVASRKISHPNVIRIHDLADFKGTLYISMEYFVGESLKKIIKQNNFLKPKIVINYLTQMCKGVNAAHQVGIIHRDLKPQNVLVNNENMLKIIDFGLAKATFMKGMTLTGLVVGTPEYMSPEQISGKKIDKRTDIYSLGVITYEMITGHVPFRGETPISIGFKHMQETPAIPENFLSIIPDWLNDVVLKMLSKTVEERFDDVSQILDIIETHSI